MLYAFSAKYREFISILGAGVALTVGDAGYRTSLWLGIYGIEFKKEDGSNLGRRRVHREINGAANGRPQAAVTVCHR